jgi:hypothetical protein
MKEAAPHDKMRPVECLPSVAPENESTELRVFWLLLIGPVEKFGP